MKKLHITLLTLVVCATSLFAQTPEKLNYQAIVRNSSDMILANTNIGMQISILEGSDSGTVVYAETQTPTTNASGLVTIEIGTGTVVSGTFNTVDWSGNSYFIKTEIDIAGGSSYTITGTSQLLSVPYALHSKTAESISGGITETDPVFIASTANGISNSDITNWNSKLTTEVDGSITNEIELPAGGTDGQVLKTDGSGNYAWVDQTEEASSPTITTISSNKTLTTNGIIFINGAHTATFPASPTDGMQLTICASDRNASINLNGKSFLADGTDYSGSFTFDSLGKDLIIVYYSSTIDHWFLN